MSLGVGALSSFRMREIGTDFADQAHFWFD
jgi:hypothetical protein